MDNSRGEVAVAGKEAAHEAVVNYREWAATMPMRQDRLARRGKAADDMFKTLFVYECQRIL